MRSRPRSNSSSSDGSLAKGNRVLIVATDNTMQRVPQYIGQVGIVKEAPVHPCTWFKIKFDDGEVFTFRPSALVGVGEDYNAETGEGIVYRSNHSSKHSTPEQIAFKGEKHVLTPVKNPNPKWLSDLDGDLWVGAVVRITTGRMKGHEGTVLRSGNGWVQVETVTFGEVAKRAHELELVSYDKSKIAFAMPKMFGNSPNGTNNASVKRPLDAIDENVGGMRTSSGRQVRPRTYSDVEDESSIRGRAGNGRAHSYDASGNLLTGPSEQKQPSAPLIHPNIKEARNQYMQKYVKKMTEKLKHRPDLMYWTHMLKASHVLSGGLPDPALERELARDFMDSVCSTCLKERWPVAKYCWNEACPASPVYYKLTGCPPPAADSAAGGFIQSSVVTSDTSSAASSTTPVEGKASRDDYVITIADDACPGDARFDVYEHDRTVKARMHLSSPQESAVVNAFSALPSVVMPSSRNEYAVAAEQNSDSSGILIVETAKSSYKIPNSANARAMLVQKLVREGLTDSDNRVCGDNWTLPEEDNRSTTAQNSTSVSISKLTPTLTSVPNVQVPVFQDSRVNRGKFPLLGLQLSGLPRIQSDHPSLLPSIPPTTSRKNTDFCLPSPNVILSDSFPGTQKEDTRANSNGLLLGGVTQASGNGSARISPYLSRGPDGFSFGSNGGPKSPTTPVN